MLARSDTDVPAVPARSEDTLGERLFPALYLPKTVPYTAEVRRLLLMSANVALLATWASYTIQGAGQSLNGRFAVAGIGLIVAAALPWQRLRQDLFLLFGLSAVAWVGGFLNEIPSAGIPLLRWFGFWIAILSSAPVLTPIAGGILGVAAAVAYSLPALERVVAPPIIAETGAADWFIVGPLLVILSVALAYYTRQTSRRQAIITAPRPAQVTNEQAAREEYMSMLYHELRNPLINVSAAARALAAQLPAASDDSERAAAIEDEAKHMLGLLDELMDVTRIELGTLRSVLAPTDLGATVNAALASFPQTTRRISVRLNSAPLPVLADEGRIRQVVTNLVRNATSYTPAGTPVEVSIGPADDGESAIVEVRDHGPGIPPAERERLFQKFDRLSTAADTRGSGLGLYICRGIVSDHGGRLWAEWPPDGGTTFSFSLPLRETVAQPRGVRSTAS